MRSIVTRAESHAHDVLHAWTIRGLLSAAFTFKVFLAHIPDEGQAVTKADVDRVASITEQVIEHLERRIDGRRDSPEAKLELATLVYRIRARLEQAVQWSRHVPS